MTITQEFEVTRPVDRADVPLGGASARFGPPSA